MGNRIKAFPFIRVGILLAFSPLMLAFLFSLAKGVSMWDEGSGSGAFIWLMLGTLPVGFLLIIIGLFTGVFRKISKYRANQIS